MLNCRVANHFGIPELQKLAKAMREPEPRKRMNWLTVRRELQKIYKKLSDITDRAQEAKKCGGEALGHLHTISPRVPFMSLRHGCRHSEPNDHPLPNTLTMINKYPNYNTILQQTSSYYKQHPNYNKPTASIMTMNMSLHSNNDNETVAF